MFINENSIQSIRQLVGEVKEYLKMQKEYTRLELIEKLTILFSTMIFIFVIVLLAILVLFYLSFSLAYLLEPYVGGLPASYAIVAGVILLLVFAVMLFKKKLIINPIANFLANLFYKNQNKP